MTRASLDESTHIFHIMSSSIHDKNDRRSRITESESALALREKELDVKEKHLLERMKDAMGGSSETEKAVLENLSSCLVAERTALTHRWSMLEADLKSIGVLEQAALNLGGKIIPLPPFSHDDMSREANEGVLPFSWPPTPQLQTSYCSIWSVQQIQLVSLSQQQQQADMPCFSCCFQR